MITISACMIVKDEEVVLQRCLDSIKDLVDEIIIVDTGSSDGTKDIAAKYTDKIYDFTWSYDFSAARNYSFSKANMDYIYVVDADERIDEENRQRFLILKQHLLPEIEIVQMKYENQLVFNTTYNFDVEYRPKLYKRLREFMWVNPVHESVELEPIVFDSDIVIEHLPINSHASRDFDIYLRTIRNEGKLSKKLYKMYARELFVAGQDKDFDEALSYFEQFSQQENYESDEQKIFECVLTKCYRLKKNPIGLMKNSLKNIADGKPCAEVCYELGEFYYELGDYREAVIWYYNAAYECECELNIHYAGDFPLKRLADCYHLLNNSMQEEAYLILCEDWRKENTR